MAGWGEREGNLQILFVLTLKLEHVLFATGELLVLGLWGNGFILCINISFITKQLFRYYKEDRKIHKYFYNVIYEGKLQRMDFLSFKRLDFPTKDSGEGETGAQVHNFRWKIKGNPS